MGLKGLAVSEKKEVLYKSHAIGGGAECGKGTQEPNERAPKLPMAKGRTV